MRAVIILVILAAVAFGGWKWYSGKQAAEAARLEAEAKAAKDKGGESGFGGGPAPAADAPVPSELKPVLDQAEALWAKLTKEGASPAATPKAPLLDKLYSQVLMGIYNKPGQKNLELKLMQERLTPLGNELFFSKTRMPDDETGLIAMHEVAPGENPDGVAKKYGMSRELLNRMRGRDLNDSKLNLSDRLKVVKVRESGGGLVHIDKSDFYLDCYLAGLFVRRYNISHGAKETPTPIGKTRLTDRVLNPTWTHPVTHEVFGPDDPKNILGKVWMAFSPDGIGQSGLGIHGYTGPNPQMQALVSNGCVRLETTQAQELYGTLAHPDRCPTAVEIVE